MFGSSAWIADYPDGDNFMQNFYGPNTHMTNWSCGSTPEFDQLYRQTQQMQAGPERCTLSKNDTVVRSLYACSNLICTLPEYAGSTKNHWI